MKHAPGRLGMANSTGSVELGRSVRGAVTASCRTRRAKCARIFVSYHVKAAKIETSTGYASAHKRVSVCSTHPRVASFFGGDDMAMRCTDYK